MSEGRELGALLFLEGRSVPFQGATCQFSVGQPASATIELPPLPEARKILPRTMVHIFVKDWSYPGGEKPWVLLFEGEIYGYGQGKSASGRSHTLYAMDYSNYWDNAKQFYMNVRTSFMDEIGALQSNKDATQARKENYQVINTVTGVSSYITKLMSDKLNAGKDFMDAVTDVVKGIEEVNPFFRYNNYRYRINERIVFKSSGKINELFDFTNRELLWDSISGAGAGGIRTIRQIINELTGLVFHDMVSVPCPSKVTKDIKSGIGPKDGQTIGSYVFKPDSFMLPPPKCNVIYPDQYANFNFSRVYFNEVSRLKFQPGLVSALKNIGQTEVFQQYFYAPSGYNEYRTGAERDAEGAQFQKSGDQGQYQDPAEGLSNTTNLADFNFLTYEEAIKGIFSDMGTTLPAANILAQVAKFDDRSSFMQKATDYLFFMKRFASRQGTAWGPLNLAPVPGFSVLFLDDSAGEQNITGTLTGIVHTVNTQGGGSTQYQVQFARNIDEEDFWDGDLLEPPIPPWFDSAIFGRNREVKPEDYKNLPKEFQEKVKKFKTLNGFEGTSLDNYYRGLLGNTAAESHLGADPVTSEKFPNMVAATYALLSAYRSAKTSDNVANFIHKNTRRDYVTLTENFKFLGADIKPGQSPFMRGADIIFKGSVFDGGFVDKAEKENNRDKALKSLFGKDITTKRRAPVNAYRTRLLNERGFRG